MSLALYRKYRPRQFAEIEGQTHILRTLQGALSSGQVGHAYLFCGPRGTGKTTLARLLAKAVNCQKRQPGNPEPCDDCPACLAVNQGNSLDLIEIDAASQTGVDNIRDLNESARMAATGGQYKVFLIDETHMLSKAAFNALLKTLEEPPAHALFILATTEPHKLPETILSRVQRLDFKKITNAQVIAKLKKVAAAEKLKVDDEALTTLAVWSGGSLRDAESALAKLVSYSGTDRITSTQTAEILGIIPLVIHEQLLRCISEYDAAAGLGLIAKLHDEGMDLENFTRQFVHYARGQLLSAVNTPGGQANPEALVKIIAAFVKAKNEFKTSPLPQLPLELAIMDLTKHGTR